MHRHGMLLLFTALMLVASTTAIAEAADAVDDNHRKQDRQIQIVAAEAAAEIAAPESIIHHTDTKISSGNHNHDDDPNIYLRTPGTRIPDEYFDRFGHHWAALFDLWPVLPFTLMFFVLRGLFKNLVVPPLAKMIGIRDKKVIPKFSYQGWLLFFYITSTFYGWMALRDKPWASFPLGETQKHAIGDKYRTVAPNALLWYYSYQIAFFTAELYAIFAEPKRSDFYEYLGHHIVTLYLMTFSWAGYEYRIGSYVLIIHDIVDIFLCLSKMTSYGQYSDFVIIPTFVVFVMSYIFYRLYCLPVLSYHIFTVVRYQHTSFNCQCLAYTLGFALQALHVFWFYLIVRLCYRMLVKGERSDLRSDDEGEDGAELAKSSSVISNNSSNKNMHHHVVVIGSNSKRSNGSPLTACKYY